MTLLEYIKDYLPKKFKVHSSFGELAELIFHLEKEGNKIFANDKFSSLRERAKLGMPYQVNIDDLEERERILNVLEIILCKHRQEQHGENYDDRIKELLSNTVLTKEDSEIIYQPKGWWSG